MPDGAKAIARFRLFNRGELAALPEVRWLVEGLLPERSVAVLYGSEGIGKTFIALATAAAVSLGKDLFGRACQKGQVLYLAGEGESGIRKRLDVWDSYHRLYAQDVYVFSGRPAIASASDVEAMCALVEQRGINPRLLEIDTLSAHFAGSNENDTGQMTLFLSQARLVSERFNCCVLIVHHKPKNGESPRGSGTISANVDTVLELAVNENKQLVLMCKKQKDGAPFEDIVIDLVRHTASEGEDEDNSSLVATLGSVIEPTLDGSPAKLTKQDQAVIRLLNEGPKRRGELRDQAGIPEGSIDAVISKLRSRALIAKQGTAKRDPFVLTETGKAISIGIP